MRGKRLVERILAVPLRITPAHAGKTRVSIHSQNLLHYHPRACGENASESTSTGKFRGSPPRMRGKPALRHFALKSHRITPAHAGKTDAHVLDTERPADHPRACGENAFLVSLLYSSHGSPPRMRGKPPRPDSLRGAHRITPAHAGKTFSIIFATCFNADHPRACGENVNVLAHLAPKLGSPPRMRGKLCRLRSLPRNPRITPAHAGKTFRSPSRAHAATDHPRACGENLDACLLGCREAGSPPRMRGKRADSAKIGALERITPAHAGKTPSAIFTYSFFPDHPRACGENISQRQTVLKVNGSPPRMRGKPIGLFIQSYQSRITPAHAGKTRCARNLHCRRSDHPRACGENIQGIETGAQKLGSPPRMRGKLRTITTCGHYGRITPAHAGKTKRMPKSFYFPTDHPRACGENYKIGEQLEKVGGSPPRMRGKLSRSSVDTLPLRITPAHAGKTRLCRIPALPSADHPRACGENKAIRERKSFMRGSPPRMRGKQKR